MSDLIVYICCILIGIIIFNILKLFKIPKLNSLVLINGGVKCGKSTMSVYFALKTYKRNLRKVKFFNFFRRLFKLKLLELPLIYSNVPLSCNYVPLNNDILLRKQRINYKSVVYIQEASLVADSMLIKDKEVNKDLLLFFKLFGHMSKGGTCIIDTQNVLDLHYAIKRSISEYFYIHHLRKGLFFIYAYCMEVRYSDDGSVVFTENNDIEDNLKCVVIPKSVWKKFDCYCYSSMTDYLYHNERTVKSKSLKCNEIFSFNKDIRGVYEKKDC